MNSPSPVKSLIQRKSRQHLVMEMKPLAVSYLPHPTHLHNNTPPATSQDRQPVPPVALTKSSPVNAERWPVTQMQPRR